MYCFFSVGKYSSFRHTPKASSTTLLDGKNEKDGKTSYCGYSDQETLKREIKKLKDGSKYMMFSRDSTHERALDAAHSRTKGDGGRSSDEPADAFKLMKLYERIALKAKERLSKKNSSAAEGGHNNGNKNHTFNLYIFSM